MALFYLFFLTPLFFVLTKINLSKPLFGLSLIYLCYHFLHSKDLPRKAIQKSILYLFVIFFSLYLSTFKVNLSSSLTQFFYYFKPIVFFWLGYFALNEKRIKPYFIFLFFFMLLGMFVFYKYHVPLIQIAVQKNKGIGGIGHFYSFGFLLRNSSLLIAPLDTGFVGFVLSFVFFHYFKVFKNWKYLFMSFGAILWMTLSFTRSAIIGTTIAFFTLFLFKLSAKARVFWSLLAFLVGISIILLNLDFFYFMFFKDNSANTHIENMVASVSAVLNNPFGLGIGTSGWVSATDPNGVYSESSIITLLIEIGFAGILIFLMQGISLYNLSSTYLFPIYLGHLATAMLIPIGLSTYFNLLFYGIYGYEVKKSFTLSDKAQYE